MSQSDPTFSDRRSRRNPPGARPWGWLLLVVAAAASGCADSTRLTRTDSRTDDFVINSRVREAMFADLSLKSKVFDISTRQGMVSLVGFVDSADDVTRAGQMARGVRGVTTVRNELRVRNP